MLINMLAAAPELTGTIDRGSVSHMVGLTIARAREDGRYMMLQWAEMLRLSGCHADQQRGQDDW